jgi:hypothetical protein
LIFEWHERCNPREVKSDHERYNFDIIGNTKCSFTNSFIFRKYFTDNTGFRKFIDIYPFLLLHRLRSEILRTVSMTEFEKDPLFQIPAADVVTISNNPYKRFVLIDNGGRRTGGDRRNYSYSIHLPERRARNDRRCGKDRRRYPRYKCE